MDASQVAVRYTRMVVRAGTHASSGTLPTDMHNDEAGLPTDPAGLRGERDPQDLRLSRLGEGRSGRPAIWMAGERLFDLAGLEIPGCLEPRELMGPDLTLLHLSLRQEMFLFGNR